MPNGLTNEDIFTGRSEVKNRVVARVFKELAYIEQWGSGINRIKSSCLEYGLKEPIIEEAGDFVGVRLFRDKNSLLENKSENLTDYGQLKVLKFLAENQKITKKETKTLIGVKDTKAKEVLSQMVESGIIERIGQGRGTYYILSK